MSHKWSKTKNTLPDTPHGHNLEIEREKRGFAFAPFDPAKNEAPIEIGERRARVH